MASFYIGPKFPGLDFRFGLIPIPKGYKKGHNPGNEIYHRYIHESGQKTNDLIDKIHLIFLPV
jgi:hypothetical protein